MDDYQHEQVRKWSRNAGYHTVAVLLNGSQYSLLTQTKNAVLLYKALAD